MKSVIGKSFGRALAEVWPVVVGVVAGYLVGLFAIAAFIHGAGIIFDGIFDSGVVSVQTAANWGVVIGVAVGVIGIMELRAKTIRVKWARDFKIWFGTDPPRNPEEMLFLQRCFMDARLCTGARLMGDAFAEENQIRFNAEEWARMQGVDLSTHGGMIEVREALIAAEKESISQKQCFWKMHRLARIFGFTVKPKYSDYLNLR